MLKELNEVKKDWVTPKQDEDTVYEKSMVRRRANRIEWFLNRGEPPCTFDEHDEQHDGETRQKKESSMDRDRASQRINLPDSGPQTPRLPFDPTVLPAFRYTAETWTDTSARQNC
ncbi:hypothetical protein KIN20_013356 [Parelaphostrongylus tenuis]|uniref:Uncharacterized protein n=1 Tax=Parelaphostrongylus tenuis TaxID=148309 RepID=A0AAD5MUH9_PARTN|nr:hypothetical protein KIN20_013356 [Parelaphostrongylus tenuis]